ncbi:MAG: amidohydrolase [Planctomycetes bacterium]|nr:amidohydrolase [Planctomycetota bacterium]
MFTKSSFGLLAGLGLTVIVACASTRSAFAPPDLVIIAHTVTLDPAHPTVEAVASRDGVIVAVGTRAEIEALVDPERTDVHVFSGATVYPGFTDSHVHLEGVGREQLELNLKGTQSLGELLERVASEAATRAPGDWITGRGWIESRWDPPEFPTRFQLDAVAQEHPVWLRRVDGHGAVANSLALRIAGIDERTVAPPGGEILKDDQGRVTGMILDAAQILVERKVPRDTAASARRALVEGSRLYVSRGWTEAQLAGTTGARAELIRDLVDSGDIELRIYNQIYGPGPDVDALLLSGPIGDQPFAKYTRRGIKVSYDGALGSGGAALLEDYADRPGNGLLNDHLDRDVATMLDAALHRGIQVEVHAIGDRANRHVLDLFEAAFARVPAASRRIPEPRFRIEHAQILSPEDLPRFAALGVIPSMQASHAITDLHFAPARLGADRLAGAYAWRALIDSGCHVAGGSDAPVEAGDPMVEFYAAVGRRDLEGFQGADWHPELAVNREEALKMLTIWAAEAAFQEQWRGTIEVGKACDLTLLDRDILEIPLEQIPSTRCVMTVVGGKVVYQR